MRFSKALLTSVMLCLTVMQSMADTVSGVVENAQGGPLANGTFTFALTQPVVLSGTATIIPSQVNCYTDSQGNAVGLPTPAAASLSVNLGSGTLPAGTYYIETAWANSTGTSEASSEQTQILASQGTLIVTAPANKQPASATQFKIYIGSTSGGETLQGTVSISGGTFAPFQQSTALAAGSAVPVSNTSVCSIHFNDEFQPSFVCYNVGLTTQSGITVPGYPQYWYLAGGTSGTVNLSQGTPQSNVCQGQGVVYPQAILAMPQNGVTQTVGGGLVVGGPLTAEAVNGTVGITSTSTDLGTQINSAITAFSSAGGAIKVASSASSATWAVAVSITKPVSLTFDNGTYSYSGTGAAITCTSSRGVTIQGSGRSGDGSASSGTTLSVSNTAANGIVASNCPGFTAIRFNLTGPGSGTGKGVINSSTRSKWDELNISSWGSDGWTTDGTATNANEGYIGKVRSSSNGGSGFTLSSNNQQGYLLAGADAAVNTGDGFAVSNSINVFQGTNCSPSALKICYHFLSGATGNVGNVFADAPSPTVTFDAGATDNWLTSTGVTITVANAGSRNYVLQSAINHDGSIGWTLFNGADTGNVLRLDSGATTVQRNILLLSTLGVDHWRIESDNSPVPNTVFYVRDVQNAVAIRLGLTAGTASELNSLSTSPIQFNVRASTGTGGTEFGDGAGNIVAHFDSAGKLVTYSGVATTGNGVPSEPATVDLMNQGGLINTTTLYAVPASGAGQYRLTWNAKVTTAATTGAGTSTLGALTIVYTDPDGVAQTITAPASIAAGTIATTSTGNSTTTVLLGLPLQLNCKASTNITYAFSYASDTAGQMKYNLHIKLESL